MRSCAARTRTVPLRLLCGQIPPSLTRRANSREHQTPLTYEDPDNVASDIYCGGNFGWLGADLWFLGLPVARWAARSCLRVTRCHIDRK
jgi:hypothetical protein